MGEKMPGDELEPIVRKLRSSDTQPGFSFRVSPIRIRTVTLPEADSRPLKRVKPDGPENQPLTSEKPAKWQWRWLDGADQANLRVVIHNRETDESIITDGITTCSVDEFDLLVSALNHPLGPASMAETVSNSDRITHWYEITVKRSVVGAISPRKAAEQLVSAINDRWNDQ